MRVGAILIFESRIFLLCNGYCVSVLVGCQNQILKWNFVSLVHHEYPHLEDKYALMTARPGTLVSLSVFLDDIVPQMPYE